MSILGNLRYPISPGLPAAVMSLLAGLFAYPDQLFCPDDLSWSANTVIQDDQLFGYGQITGVYLLELAAHHQGRLISFDARLSPAVALGRALLRLELAVGEWLRLGG